MTFRKGSWAPLSHLAGTPVSSTCAPILPADTAGPGRRCGGRRRPWVSPPRIDVSESQESVTQEDAAKRNQPGLLMFRWDGPANNKQPTTVYIFLVGDVATAGINGAQFDKAVNYVSEICRSNGEGKCGPPIEIMGPTFSGSLSSLRYIKLERI
jgi:hypothetical protein